MKPSILDSHPTPRRAKETIRVMEASDLFLIIVAILLPPVTVLYVTGCGGDLLLNIILTILGYIPGHIHAFYIMHEKIKAEKEFGPEHVEYDGAIGHFKQRRVGVEYVKGEETVNDGIVRSAHSEKVMWW